MSGDKVTSKSLGPILAQHGIDYPGIWKEEIRALDDEEQYKQARQAVATLDPAMFPKDGPAAPPEPPAPRRAPEWIGYPPGMAGVAARWLEAGNPVNNPMASVATVLGFVAGVCGRTWHNAGGQRPDGINLYLCLLAPSGGGKEWMWGGLSRLVYEAGLSSQEGKIVSSRPASGPALEKMISRAPSTIMPLPEVGKWFQRILGKNANGAEIALQGELLAIYTKSAPHASYCGQSKAAEEAQPIAHPSLTVLGETTPSSLWAALSDESVRSGLLSRMIFLDSGETPGEDRYSSSVGPVPPELREVLMDMSEAWTTETVERRAVRWSSEALEVDRARFLEWSESKQAGTDHVREVISRMRQNAPRVAAVLALCDDPRDPEVSAKHCTWSWDMVEASCRRILEAFESGDVVSDESMTNVDILMEYCISAVGLGGMIERRKLQSGVKRRIKKGPSESTHTRALREALNDALECGLLAKVGPQDRPEAAVGGVFLVVSKE